VSDFIIEDGILKKYTGAEMSIIIPEGVTTIAKDSLPETVTSIVVPASLKTIENSLSHRKLESIYISDIAAWCNIDTSAFSFIQDYTLFLNGEIVTDLVIPEGVTVIKEGVFYGCKSIKSITIPNSLKTIKLGAFSNCDSLKEFYISSIEAWCNIDLYFGFPEKDLYLNGELITHFIVPEGITSFSTEHIASNHIKEITIPPSVKKINVYTPFKCPKLNIQDIKAWCNTELYKSCEDFFKYMWTLYLDSEPVTHLEIPEGIKTIKKGTFCACNLESVVIPEGVECIEESAFRYCKNLKRACLPSTIRTIQDYAFASDFNMNQFIFLRDSGVFISNSAFKYCEAMQEIWPKKTTGYYKLWTICSPEYAEKILREDDPIYLRLEQYNKSDYDKLLQEADEWRIVGNSSRFGYDGYTGAGFNDSDTVRRGISSEMVVDNFHFVGILKYSYYGLVVSKPIDVIYIKDWKGTPILYSKEEYVYEDGLWEKGSSHELYFVKNEEEFFDS